MSIYTVYDRCDSNNQIAVKLLDFFVFDVLCVYNIDIRQARPEDNQ